MNERSHPFLIGVFVILLFVSAYIRIGQTANYNFPFSFDQSRDMLNIRIPGSFKDLFLLIGPTTSIDGLFLGPGYYYFNLPAYWLFGGNPQGLIYWNIFWFLLASVAIFRFFKKNIFLGFFLSISFLFAPLLFDTSRYFWNAHAMIYMVVFYFLSLLAYLQNPSSKNAILLGIFAGLTTQFELAFAIIIVIFSFIYILFSKRKHLSRFLLGLIPWFLPQIIYETTRGFPVTKILLNEYGQNSGVFGQKMPYFLTLKTHFSFLQRYLEGQYILPPNFGKILLIITTIGGLISKKFKKITITLLVFFFSSLLIFTLLYRYELKKWYPESLRVWYLFTTCIGIFGWYEIFKKSKIFLLFVFLFLTNSVYLTIVDQKHFVNNPTVTKDDPKLLNHQLQTIDWIYQKMAGQNFTALNYVEEIYDYPYQYIYWWYGRSKYGYMPSYVGYFPNITPYVPKQDLFYQDSKKEPADTLGLIYERKPGTQTWLDNFNNYCLVDKIDFSWNLSAQIRKKCQ